MKKRQWQKPELIVLVRGKPEEAVLTTCKVAGNYVSMDVNRTGCKSNYGNTNCGICQNSGTS